MNWKVFSSEYRQYTVCKFWHHSLNKKCKSHSTKSNDKEETSKINIQVKKSLVRAKKE